MSSTDLTSVPAPPRITARCALVRSADEVGLHHRIRHEVFVTEQAVFDGHDRDDLDEAATTRKALGYYGSEPAGTVRLYPTSADATQWQGDRLAVLAPFRQRRVGGPLVDFAVSTAALLGGDRMTAHIQLPNVAFFESLGWAASGDVETYVGLPHQPMDIDVRRRHAERAAGR